MTNDIVGGILTVQHPSWTTESLLDLLRIGVALKACAKKTNGDKAAYDRLLMEHGFDQALKEFPEECEAVLWCLEPHNWPRVKAHIEGQPPAKHAFDIGVVKDILCGMSEDEAWIKAGAVAIRHINRRRRR